MKTRECSHRGCKVKATIGAFCKKHAEKNDPVEQAVKMSELEALKFGKMDAEMRNCLQGIQLADYEVNRIRIEAQQKMEQQQMQRSKLTSQLERLKAEYVPFVKELAKKYDMPDPEKMAIDPDSRIIRDISDPVK
jgi:DNA repair ATPase RecN